MISEMSIKVSLVAVVSSMRTIRDRHDTGLLQAFDDVVLAERLYDDLVVAYNELLNFAFSHGYDVSVAMGESL